MFGTFILRPGQKSCGLTVAIEKRFTETRDDKESTGKKSSSVSTVLGS